MKKRIVGTTGVLVLATGIFAASVGAATTQTTNTAGAGASITSLNHAVKTPQVSAMQIAIDNAAARAAAEEAARQAAELAAKQAAANAGGSVNYVGSGDSGAQEAAAEEGDLWSILASFGVADVSIAYGDARGYEAIAYYKRGHIVINSNHTTSLYTLIAHEVEHIVAYRESGKTTE